jgi:hypothetical protein
MIARFPEAVAIRHIALYGPLTNGVVGERIGLAVIMQDAVAALQASLWDKLNVALVQAEHAYALRFDCLLLTEHEIADTAHPSNAWLTIAHEHVVMWP